MSLPVKIFAKPLVGSVNFSAVNYSIYRQSRILRKLLDREQKNQKKQKNASKKLAQQILPPSNQVFNKRLAAINKFYMQHITEVMQGEEYSSRLIDLGIEVTQVKILKDHSQINIYWISNNENFNEEELKEILPKAAGELHRTISSLRNIGKLPELRFVRDLYVEKQREVEKLLSVVDFGRDYEPQNPSQGYGSNSFVDADGNESETRQDVLGLDHAKISQNILANMKHKIIDLPEKEFNYEEVDSTTLIPFDKTTFEKFYRRRQILKRKLEKTADMYLNKDDDSENLFDEREKEFLKNYWSNSEFDEVDHEDEEDFHENQR